jgi:four helix bundle protein
MRNFEDLEVWKRSCRLATCIYKAFEKCHDSGFYSQITRAAISVASNIAEGSERRTDKEFINFIYIAKGSLGELRTQLYIANRIGYIPDSSRRELVAETKELSSMLQGLIRKLQ